MKKLVNKQSKKEIDVNNVYIEGYVDRYLQILKKVNKRDLFKGKKIMKKIHRVLQNYGTVGILLYE